MLRTVCVAWLTFGWGASTSNARLLAARVVTPPAVATAVAGVVGATIGVTEAAMETVEALAMMTATVRVVAMMTVTAMTVVDAMTVMIAAREMIAMIAPRASATRMMTSHPVVAMTTMTTTIAVTVAGATGIVAGVTMTIIKLVAPLSACCVLFFLFHISACLHLIFAVYAFPPLEVLPWGHMSGHVVVDVPFHPWKCFLGGT